jgi:tetratricopeptide (TPR) repeat protein
MMRKIYLPLTVVMILALAFAVSGCQKLKARDSLNRGVHAFRSANYVDAVDYFQKAVELDPEFTAARLYLATAYMSQYIPGAVSPENQQFVKNAEENFQKVLDMDPNNAIAIESMASLYYNQAQGMSELSDKIAMLDKAAGWYQRLVKADPQRKEAFYSLGVIAWAKWYPQLMKARADLGMKPEDPGPLKDEKVREQLKDEYGAVINDGISNLEHALKIDPEYDDAMAYMNLLIRERADLADNKDTYQADIDTADKWVTKALDTKKIKAERAEKASQVVTSDE